MDKTQWNLEEIERDKYIKSLLEKDYEKLTKDELEEIDRWNEEQMRSEFTMVGGF